MFSVRYKLNLYIYVNFSIVLKTSKYFMYNEQTNAQLIDSFIVLFFIYRSYRFQQGDRGSTVVKVLCYNSEGRWFDPSWCHWIFSLTWYWGRLSL